MMAKNSNNLNLDNWDSIIMDPLVTGCSVMKRFGGRYMKGCHLYDGHKFVCMDNFPKNQEVLLTTFGIFLKFTFKQPSVSTGKTFASTE